MVLLTQTASSDVLYRHIEELSSVFPRETQTSLLHMLAGKDVGPLPLPGTGKDTRYQVPLFRAGGPVPLLATFSLLTNHLEEVAIPRMVFVGTQQAASGNTRPLMQQQPQGGGGGGGGGGMAAPPPLACVNGGIGRGGAAPPQDLRRAAGGGKGAEGGAPDSQAFVQLVYALHSSSSSSSLLGRGGGKMD